MCHSPRVTLMHDGGYLLCLLSTYYPHNMVARLQVRHFSISLDILRL